MKRIFTIFGIVFMMFLGVKTVQAAPSQNFYTSASSIESGSRVTATLQLKNVAAWNVKIVSNGSTSGCDASFADATSNGQNTTKNLSVTCNSTGIGQISFRVSGDATSADGSSINVSGVKVVTVRTPREKDSNNYLKSLSVKDYQISPAFHQDTLAYSVNVPSTVDKVVIEGVAASSYANVTGVGEVEVNEGANTFDIVVTSETGVERTYKLTVNVKDENPITVTVNDQEYTIVKNAKNIVKPDTYEATTIQINQIEVPAFQSDITGFLLVALKDHSGKTFFAIYHEEDQSYELYNEQKSPEMTIYIMNPIQDLEGFHKTIVEINGESYPAFQVKEDSKFAVVYGMNVETGKTGYYIYHMIDNTFQEYFDEVVVLLLEEKKIYEYIILGCMGVSFLLFVLCIIGFARKPRHKKEELIESELMVEKNIEEPVQIKKQEKKTKRSNKPIEEKQKDIKVEEPPKEETDSLEVKDAIEKMNDVEEIIREYEKTLAISKEEIEKAKKSSEEDDEENNQVLQAQKKKKR